METFSPNVCESMYIIDSYDTHINHMTLISKSIVFCLSLFRVISGTAGPIFELHSNLFQAYLRFIDVLKIRSYGFKKATIKKKMFIANVEYVLYCTHTTNPD